MPDMHRQYTSQYKCFLSSLLYNHSSFSPLCLVLSEAAGTTIHTMPPHRPPLPETSTKQGLFLPSQAVFYYHDIRASGGSTGSLWSDWPSTKTLVLDLQNNNIESQRHTQVSNTHTPRHNICSGISTYTVGAIIIWSLADFAGFAHLQRWNCV